MKKYYLLFIFIILFLSYGQILRMYIWQDDNALFFKLAHIEENAGYLSAGPFGIGPYKYIVTPHILIHSLFGFSTIPYFATSLLLYFLSVVCVYKVFSKLYGEKEGKIAGFLYAAGYIASDGYIRLFNSAITSLSIIFISGITLCYYRFYRERKFGWYLCSLILFFFSLELVRIRTHYLIFVIVLFELIFFSFIKPTLRSIAGSLIRLIPFGYIFYRYFLANMDPRGRQVENFIVSIVRGSYYQLFGFLSSVANVVTPDWFTNQLFRLDLLATKLTGVSFPYPLVVLFGVGLLVCIIGNRKLTKKSNLTIIFFCSISLCWYLVSKSIFKTPLLNASANQLFIAFLGGEILLFLVIMAIFLNKRDKSAYIFFLLWLIANIGSYSAYNPTVIYESVNRYLAHSFFAVIGLFVVIIHSLKNDKNKFYSKLFLGMVIFWGIGNLISAFFYQNRIVKNRSLPARNFYIDLKSHLPVVRKGDLLYFDVADNARGYFADAFSVASMPEETAIAWRYGIDRYDIRVVTEYQKLLELLKEGTFGDINDQPIKIANLYTFFYSQDGLEDTTDEFQRLLKNKSVTRPVKYRTQPGDQRLLINFDENLSALSPLMVTFDLKANLKDLIDVKYPYISDKRFTGNPIYGNPDLTRLAYRYLDFKNDLRVTAKITATNFWMDDKPQYVLDGDTSTNWRAHRVLWNEKSRDGGAILDLDLKKMFEIDQFVWVNTYANNTPIDYSLAVSSDDQIWKKVVEVKNNRRIESGDLVVMKFPSVLTRFVRFQVNKTLNDDSPGISEIWVVPSAFSGLNIHETEEFLTFPFGSLLNESQLYQTLLLSGYRGKIQVGFLTDKYEGITERENLTVNVVYDNKLHSYSAIIPAGGTILRGISLREIKIPEGTIEVEKIQVEPLPGL